MPPPFRSKPPGKSARSCHLYSTAAPSPKADIPNRQNGRKPGFLCSLGKTRNSLKVAIDKLQGEEVTAKINPVDTVQFYAAIAIPSFSKYLSAEKPASVPAKIVLRILYRSIAITPDTISSSIQLPSGDR